MLGTKQQLSLIQNEMAFFYQEYAQFGGYPKVVLASSAEMKREYLKQIYESYIQKDIKDIGKIKEVEKFNKLIRLLANQSGNLLNLSEISNTIDVTQKTVHEWIFLLENTFVLQLVTPFSTNLRGELTKMPKVFFLDNGLRNYCDKDFELSGNSFENAFFSTVHHSYRFQELHFYRTQDKKEVDFVLDGKGYELKLSYNGKNLTSLDYFIGKLGLSGAIVTLEKRNNPKYEILYPWEV